jgi:hypothetical protein
MMQRGHIKVILLHALPMKLEKNLSMECEDVGMRVARSRNAGVREFDYVGMKVFGMWRCGKLYEDFTPRIHMMDSGVMRDVGIFDNVITTLHLHY